MSLSGAIHTVRISIGQEILDNFEIGRSLTCCPHPFSTRQECLTLNLKITPTQFHALLRPRSSLVLRPTGVTPLGGRSKDFIRIRCRSTRDLRPEREFPGESEAPRCTHRLRFRR